MAWVLALVVARVAVCVVKFGLDLIRSVLLSTRRFTHVDNASKTRIANVATIPGAVSPGTILASNAPPDPSRILGRILRSIKKVADQILLDCRDLCVSFFGYGLGWLFAGLFQ